MVPRGRVFTLAALLLWPGACADRERRAEPTPRAQTATADADFEHGTELAQKARYDEALACFEKARGAYQVAGELEKALASQARIGEIQIEQGHYDEALSLLTKALEAPAANLPASSLAIAEVHQALGHAYWRKGRYDDALAYLKKALSVRVEGLGEQHPEVARSYHHLGETYQRRGEVEQALRFHALALEIRQRVLGDEHAAVAESANSLAGDYWMRGEYDRALDLCQRAAAIWRAALGDKHPKTAKAYGNIGILYAMKGDYDRSLEFARRQLEIELASVGEHHPSVANVRMNVGLTLRYKGELNEALSQIQQAIAGFSAALGKDNPQVANGYVNLASVLNRKGDHGQAARYCERALAILAARFGEKHPLVAEARQELAETRRLQRRYGEAAASHEKALAIRRALFGDSHPDVAQSLNGLALVAAERGDHDRALEYVQQAIRANIPTLLDSDPYSNPPLINMLSEEALLGSLQQKGQVLTRRFEARGGQRDLEAAVASYRQASRLVDRMRGSYKAEGSKLFLAERASGLYDEAIRAARRLLEVAPGEDSREAAFLFAEKSRGGILLEALSDAEAKQFAGIPTALLEEERRLRAELAFRDRSLIEEQRKGAGGEPEKRARSRDELFELQRKYEAFLHRLEREHLDYYNLKYQLRTASLGEVQRDLLDAETTLVEYFLGRDSIVIYTITRESFAVTAVPRPAELERQVEELRRAIVARDDDGSLRAGHALYQVLLAPVTARLTTPSLIVVPDGVLGVVPFEALLTEAVERAGGSVEHTRLPYLLKRYAVRLGYSATLLLQSRKRERPAPRAEYVAFAPVFAGGAPATDATRALGPLPASRAEVTRIEQLFLRRHSLWERLLGTWTRVYLDRAATEDKVKGPDLARFRFVHFATHGIVDDVHPALSGLRLSPGGRPAEDGMLHLGEIYSLSLDADLVVLSACDTGLGRIASGEGMLGLTRGFLYAGAGSLLVSLWRVGDVPTAEIMTTFYERMLSGNQPARALREAKLDIMGRNPELARPYYWSAFVLIGR